MGLGITHVNPTRGTRQGGCQRHPVGAALTQHGRNQERQVLALRLALLRQPLLQHRANASGRVLDPTHLSTRSTQHRAQGAMGLHHTSGLVVNHLRLKLMGGEAASPFSALLTLWLSMMATVGRAVQRC